MMRVVVGIPPVEKYSSEKSSGRLSAGGAVGFQTFPANISPPEALEWEKLSIEELLSVATTASLLGDMSSFRLTGALNGSRADEFLDITKDLVASPHYFTFIEEKLLKKPTDMVTKAGAEVVVYATKKKDTGASASGSFNLFAITYAFAARDRKKLWLLLHEALQSGAVPEAVAGMLHWKVRDMLSKGEKGKFSSLELRRISKELVTVYHDSHRGVGDLSLLLERYLLRL